MYSNFEDLLNTIRTLSHSNADAETVFSTITDVLTDKRNRLNAESVNSLCVVKLELQANQESPATMTIMEEYLKRRIKKQCTTGKTSKESRDYICKGIFNSYGQ